MLVFAVPSRDGQTRALVLHWDLGYHYMSHKDRAGDKALDCLEAASHVAVGRVAG
jgi:hypothetical protein